MTGDQRTLHYLEDMLEHARCAVEFVSGKSEESFSSDRMLQFAVVRALEVVGEAAKAVPDEVRELAPDIPWRQITGMRDKLIHRYFGVEAAVVWATVATDVPDLIDDLEKLVELFIAQPGERQP